MKHIIRTFIFAIMMIASCTTAFAEQYNDTQRPNQKQRISREQLAEVQAKHIANTLAFSDAITEKFVQTYCNYQKEIWALGPRFKAKNGSTNEQENEAQIKQRFARSEKILNIRQKYYKEYSKFLTQTQIEKVYEQERKMMKRLAQRGQGQRGKGQHRPSPRNAN